jgi:microcompartment protein CcmK/EutM
MLYRPEAIPSASRRLLRRYAPRNDKEEKVMLIARVIGTTVSTVKDEKLTGRKLLILRQTDETGSPTGKPYVAVDTVDAGIGDLVLTAAGSSARQTTITKDTPVDAVIMAVIDSLEVEGKVVFRKSLAVHKG